MTSFGISNRLLTVRRGINMVPPALDEYPVVERGKGSAGIVKTRFARFFEPPEPLILTNGKKLGPVDVAYETYGKLNENRDNVILVLHALTGSAHAAGKHSESDEVPGWWDAMIGPGKAFDTNRYFIVSPNILGSCYGTTGPSSVNPETGKPYGSSFPVISIPDMVRVQKALMDHLEIEKIYSVAGGSMGGMQAIEWALMYPDSVDNLILLATSPRTTPMSIGIHKVGLEAIMSDPNWNNGDYYDSVPPATGLKVARMIGHITYLSDAVMWEKFGRETPDREKLLNELSGRFEVEKYLEYQSDKFVKRFDANSYVFIMRAMDNYDASEGYETLEQSFSRVKCSKVFIASFSHDWLFPPYQSEELADAFRENKIEVTYRHIESPYGHDSFLLEHEKLRQYINEFYGASD